MLTNFLSVFWMTVILLSPLNISSQPNYPTNPENAQLIYTDLKNFVDAYEHLEKNSDTIAVLNKYYFDRASAGLKEFINRHKLSPELLMKAMIHDPEPYGKVKGFVSEEESFKLEFAETMQKFHGVLPSTMYAPTYLLVGANRGIGQASKEGQLVTLEKVVDRKNVLKKLIVHELAHFQQAMTMGPQNYAALYSKPDNMLGLCLREGGAEFVTSLVLQEITQSKGLLYYQENEQELKKRFSKDVKENDQEYWLWDSIKDPDAPKLLGYVLGYKICKSFFDLSDDKELAIRRILLMDSPDQFLNDSKYFE